MSRWMAAFLLLAVAAGATIAAAAEPAGTVLALNGDCFVERGGTRAKLALGNDVQAGDSVVVADGAKLKLRMSDGSIIVAASGTKLTVAAFVSGAGGRDAKLTLASGLLHAVVAAVGQPSHFEVDTATGVAAVRSTDWFIEAKPAETQVGVLSGVVDLASAATGRRVEIPARWGARVEAGKDPVQARVWRDAEFAAVIARTNLE